MARSESKLAGGVRLSDVATLGALSARIPSAQIKAAVDLAGRASERKRSLPAEFVVLYVMAMWIYRDASYEEVLSCLAEGFRWLGVSNLRGAGKSAVSQARERLGAEPLRLLFERLAVPLATRETKGAWYRKWRTVAWDGTTLETPDEKENAEAFGYPENQHGVSAFPQIQALALVETGTHAPVAAAMGPYKTSENELAREVMKRLEPNMLLLADRLFFGAELWQEASLTGAALLWRVEDRLILKPESELEDGSYLARIYPRGRKKKNQGMLVRVVEFKVKGSEEKYRLATNVLSHKEAPALELAHLYKERWENELAFDEIKTHLKGARLNLRSKKPELVKQEFWGLMLLHWALRDLIHKAALAHSKDPDEISFTHTLRLVRRTLPNRESFSP